MTGQPLTAAEVAGLLDCSARTVIRLAGKGELPSQRLGAKQTYVFDRADVVKYLAAQVAKATELAERASS